MVTKDELEEKMNTLETNITGTIGQKIINARDSIDQSIEKHSGESVKRDRALDDKGNEIAHKLGSRDVFKPEDISVIKHISPFPVSLGE